MAITEIERVELAQALTTVIGEVPAGLLMSSILPEGRDHLATKADLEILESRTRAEFAKIYGEFAKIDGEFAKIYGEFAKVYGAIDNLRGETALMVARQTRTMLLALGACMVTTWGGMLAGFLTLASMISG